ncbi:hypothetical protein [Aggregatibacter kilianii]|uniref:hypothetical protein n=1 Tax=Aggregatibacter kilianii TaxID=2025884 RepID=UPI000D643FD1|nr:hypothetical protein [Aggregatibacter kilianii]
MAYQTGTATNVADLLGKLAEFAAPLNWVIQKNAENALYLSNADGYWALEFKDNMLFVIAGTGVDKNRDCFNQPGASCNNSYRKTKTRTSHLQNGNFVSYDFFGTAQYLHVCVQYQAERFRHFGLGTLNKEGQYTGGQYALGTTINNSSYDRPRLNSRHTFGMSSGDDDYGPVVRADNIGGDTRTPWYFCADSRYEYSLSGSETGCYMLTNGRTDDHAHSPDRMLLTHSQSKFGQLAIPVPNAAIAQCKDNLFRRLGTVPDRYECKIVGIVPRQKLQINGETWMFIPSAQYQSAATTIAAEGNDNSGEYGVAYRIIE